MNSPEPAWNSCTHFVSANCQLDFKGPSGAFVSAAQNRVSRGQRFVLAKTRGSNLELMGGKAKHLVLLGPCGGQVGETGNAHAI